MFREVSRLTGIQVVTEFRFLGVQIRATYQKCKDTSFKAVHERITAKCNRLYASKVDLFHKRQIIKSVVKMW
jgi:hypothetical protein